MGQMGFLKLQARDVMQKNVITLSPETVIKDAWAMFFANKISGAPVVSKGGELLGVVSQHDLVRHVFNPVEESKTPSTYYYGLPSIADGFVPMADNLHQVGDTIVEEIMMPYVITVPPDAPLPAVVATMRSHHIHRIIVAEGKKVVGILSTFDLLALLEGQ